MLKPGSGFEDFEEFLENPGGAFLGFSPGKSSESGDVSFDPRFDSFVLISLSWLHCDGTAFGLKNLSSAFTKLAPRVVQRVDR